MDISTSSSLDGLRELGMRIYLLSLEAFCSCRAQGSIPLHRRPRRSSKPSAKTVPEEREDTGLGGSSSPVNASLLAPLGHLWADTSSPGCPRGSGSLAVFYSPSTQRRCSSHFTQRQGAQGGAGLPWDHTGACQPGSLRAGSWRTGSLCLKQQGRRCTGREEGISDPRGITGKSLMLLDKEETKGRW